MSNPAVIEGLNIYRAVEACGERIMQHWAATTPEEDIREGFAAIAEREGNHARLLAERIVALGAEPGPSCVDEALADFIARAEDTTGSRERLEQFNALVAGQGETAQVMANCGQAIRTAVEQGDADTKTMLAAIFSDEKLSIEWCAAHASIPASAGP
jgi:DNA-binding ferritin-like protein